jgi:hypothetical protein
MSRLYPLLVKMQASLDTAATHLLSLAKSFDPVKMTVLASTTVSLSLSATPATVHRALAVWIVKMMNDRVDQTHVGTMVSFDVLRERLDGGFVLGTCMNISNIAFVCLCDDRWMGLRCELEVDHCANASCENDGVCHSVLDGYECECLTSSYSGRHCEVVSNSLIGIKTASRSFGYVAICCLVGVCVLIVTLDLMKYVFNINTTKSQPTRPVRTQSNKVGIALRLVYIETGGTQ